MTFFLLKWVFNAIKMESRPDDKHLKGQSYVSKAELVKQLNKNKELLTALRFEKGANLEKAVQKAKCSKDGTLTWSEFLNFSFDRNTEKMILKTDD